MSMISHDCFLVGHDRILNVAMLSGANGIFVEFDKRQRYTVACPVNAHEGMAIAASITAVSGFC